MKKLIETGVLSEKAIEAIGKPKIRAGDIERLVRYDKVLQQGLFLQEEINEKVRQEFSLGLNGRITPEIAFGGYCLSVLKDMQQRTKVFDELKGHTEEHVKQLVGCLNLERYIPLMLYLRKNEVLPESESKDKASTSLHNISVTMLGLKMGEMLGLKKDELRVLAFGLLHHDIGKSLLYKIINKEGALSERERRIMQLHPEIGETILSEMGYGLPKESLEIVRWHHEKMNGSGYPDGLRGEAIPMYARIASGADIFYALLEDRTYPRESGKTNFTVKEALNHMIENSSPESSLLDRKVVDCLVALNRESREWPEKTGYY